MTKDIVPIVDPSLKDPRIKTKFVEANGAIALSSRHRCVRNLGLVVRVVRLLLSVRTFTHNQLQFAAVSTHPSLAFAAECQCNMRRQRPIPETA